MTAERLEQIRAAIAEKPVGELEHVLPELLAEVDRLRAAAGLVQFALERNHMAMVVLAYGREIGLFTQVSE